MLAVRLDKEMGKQLEELANKTHRPKSYYVKEAVKRYLEKQTDYEIDVFPLCPNLYRHVPAQKGFCYP
ncbi:MAG: ribbon-helix-helix protein, CopG family [Deltaproteobacteria bacterium]|nr:ribbon-helix-helix protein, CopG family [Deltaproteobacteria bacterium]